MSTTSKDAYETSKAAQNLPDDKVWQAVMRKAVEDIHGFVYNGDGPAGAVEMVRWMRTNPNLARFLLSKGGSPCGVPVAHPEHTWDGNFCPGV